MREERLLAMQGFVEENFVDVNDLVTWLNLSIEDVMQAFPSKLLKKYKECYGNEEEES